METTTPLGSEFISTLDKKCRIKFELLLDLAHAYQSSSVIGDVSVSECSNVFERYQVWSANVGASQTGDRYKRSLDYRMREAPFYKMTVLKVLHRLVEVLSALTDALQTRTQNRKVAEPEDEISPEQHEESMDEAISDWAISDSSSGSDSDVAVQRKVKAMAEPWSRLPVRSPDKDQEVSGYFLALKFTITCLYKLPVRNMTPAARLHSDKRGRFDESSLYLHFDIMFVRDLFPLCGKQVAYRLGRLITRRRHLMHYRHAHNLELQRETIESTAAQTLTSTKALYPTHNNEAFEDVPPPIEMTESSVIQSTIKASTFDPKLVPQPPLSLLSPKTPSEAETSTSIATTRTGQEYLPIPPRPTDADGNELENFECTYCGLVAHVRLSAKSWKRHVFHDLEPYVCVSADCPQHEVTYANKDEWFEHQRQHLEQYHCGDKLHKTFDDKLDFREHMFELHKLTLPTEALVSSTSLFSRSMHPNAPLTCLLCRQVTTQLKQHLSRHLERIALFALPRIYDAFENPQSQVGEDGVSMKMLDGSRSGNPGEELVSSDSDADPGDQAGGADELTSESNVEPTDTLTSADQIHFEDIDERETQDPLIPDTNGQITWQHVKPQLESSSSQLHIKSIRSNDQSPIPDFVTEQDIEALFAEFAPVGFTPLGDEGNGFDEGIIHFRDADGADKARSFVRSVTKNNPAALPISFTFADADIPLEPIHQTMHFRSSGLKDMPVSLTDSDPTAWMSGGEDESETRERLDELAACLDPETLARFGLDYAGRRIIWVRTLKRLRRTTRKKHFHLDMFHRVVLLDNLLITLSSGPEEDGMLEVQVLFPLDLLLVGGERSSAVSKEIEFFHMGRNKGYQYEMDMPDHYDAWVRAIRMAKTLHNARLASADAIPFSLSALVSIDYEGHTVPPVSPTLVIPGSPLSRCLESTSSRPIELIRPDSRVDRVTYLEHKEVRYLALCTTSGLYIFRHDDQRGPIRFFLAGQKITGAEWNQQHNLIIVLADGELLDYNLNDCLRPGGARSGFQNLAKEKNIEFFHTTFMDNHHLVFLCRKSIPNSVFTVLRITPSGTSNKWLRAGSRRASNHDEFYVPYSCSHITTFKTTVVMLARQGFEVMVLDKKQTYSVPYLRSEDKNVIAGLEAVASRIANHQGLGMFRLSQIEFLLVYDDCAVYINQRGDPSRSVIMEFSGVAKSVAFYRGHLFLFNDNFVEIRNAENGQMVQIVPGIEIVMLDDGRDAPLEPGQTRSWTNTVKFRMRHPEKLNTVLVVEFTPFVPDDTPLSPSNLEGESFVMPDSVRPSEPFFGA